MWQIYMIRCRNGSLYTGITNNLFQRIQVHGAGAPGSAKYLRGKGPFSLVFTCEVGTRSEALKVEMRVKKLPKAKKEALVAGRISLQALDILH